MKGKHITVLLHETVDSLCIKAQGTYVDCTLGGGGHSELICKELGESGRLIGIDQDTYALERASARLAPYLCEKVFVHDSFFNLDRILKENAPDGVDGIIFDLGVSSFQFDDADRGFSYHNDGPLDMRMDRSAALMAADIVATYDKAELVRVLKEFGEERFAGRIADRIITQREKEPIVTTLALSDIVRGAYPAKERYKEKHPARKTFQALRIEVNHELDYLEDALAAGIHHLRPGGRMSVITFHSLEDRLVKQYFKKCEHPCTCPPDFPVCICGKKPEIKGITRKPIAPPEEELEINRRARSAKLRVIEKR
ncbi:16S rRNA (cytosine1402-N4)-methyltransferase [Eubacterium aggregans]|uniref:Ribosomal RNA small subunit methyltransferase H n=1 Tax=Eubacterium aggregans TaxID=81409 RepID=A0A1H3XLQ6_9FIRM|nr:16S rRNA (cytosine(1402)-N(4))-methyltransferase RsmH [Eubacterium aggregans]SDZ99554.1 16S rRNA (cytosine1402-N4)-methyltransferase [Eubacterium aggregans]